MGLLPGANHCGGIGLSVQGKPTPGEKPLRVYTLALSLGERGQEVSSGSPLLVGEGLGVRAKPLHRNTPLPQNELRLLTIRTTNLF